jgi:pyruvate carboxylase
MIFSFLAVRCNVLVRNGTDVFCRACCFCGCVLQPDSGRLEAYRVPGGPGIRLDGAVTAGNVVSRYYDSLLAKVIANAPTYDKAIQRMARALQEFQVGRGKGSGRAAVG